jgi:hypothetical protein
VPPAGTQRGQGEVGHLPPDGQLQPRREQAVVGGAAYLDPAGDPLANRDAAVGDIELDRVGRASDGERDGERDDPHHGHSHDRGLDPAEPPAADAEHQPDHQHAPAQARHRPHGSQQGPQAAGPQAKGAQAHHDSAQTRVAGGVVSASTLATI